MATDPHNPSALEISAAPPWYKKPAIAVGAVVSVMVSVSLWSYAMNPDWLGESEESNLLVERILQLNPNLTEEDLAKDIQSDNLSFWFGRADQQYAGVATTQEGGEESDRPTVLEEFLKQNNSDAEKSAGASAAATPPTPAATPSTASPTSATDTTVSPAPNRSALDIAINGVGGSESVGVTPLQRAIDQATAASRVDSTQPEVNTTTTSTTGTGLNNTNSVYENNTGLPTNPAGASVSGNVGGNTGFPNNTVGQPVRTRRATPSAGVGGQPAVFTPRSRRDATTSNFDASAYGSTTVPQGVNAATQPSTRVNNNQRRQSTDFNTGNTYRRVGNGEIESFANPLGQN